MTSSLIRYNYPFLYCHPPDLRAILYSVHSKQCAQHPLLAGKPSSRWCLLAVNGPYGKWRGSSFDTISFNRSLGATCLNTLCTPAPSRIVCHLLWTTLIVEEEHVGCFKCNLIESNYKIKHRRKTAFCLIAEQTYHMPKKGVYLCKHMIWLWCEAFNLPSVICDSDPTFN